MTSIKNIYLASNYAQVLFVQNKHELGEVPMFEEYKLTLIRVVKKNICKYILYLKMYVNSRQNVGNAINKVKVKLSLALLGLLRNFHTRFIPFYNKIKIIYLLQSQGVCLTFLNVNDVRIPLLLKVKSPTSPVMIPLL